MKNIVYIINTLKNSGPGNVLINICKYLNRDLFNPIILTLTKPGITIELEDFISKYKIKHIKLDYNFIQLELFPKKIAKDIEYALSDFDDYLVHAHCYHPTIIASHLRKRTICTIHNISIQDFVFSKGQILGRYMSLRYCNRLSSINFPITISDYMENFYKKRCPYKNFKTIYNGVDLKYSSNLKISETTYQNLNIDKEKKIIAIVGRLSKRKNVQYIISELKKSKLKNFICIILGAGEEYNNILKEINNDERFKLMGKVNNVKDFLLISNLFISASFSEGLPLSVIEALNMGVPVLISNIPPHQEISKKLNQQSVALFDIKPNMLLHKFEEYNLVNENRNILSEKSYKAFSAESMSIKYQKIYSTIK